MERAKEDLQAACVNHNSGLFKAAINRSYYAIFHSIRAVNILDGFDASKHSSVIAHFNQYYVHTGEFDRGIYKIIDGAYRIREKCDYQVAVPMKGDIDSLNASVAAGVLAYEIVRQRG